MNRETYIAVGELVQAAAHAHGLTGPIPFTVCREPAYGKISTSEINVPNTPQPSIPMGFSRPWFVRRPQVHRYLEKQWVDLFFEDGSLMISSFDSFARHPDEARQDDKEGSAILVNANEDNTWFAALRQGFDAYVLCGSGYYSDDLVRTFGKDSGFRINDTVAFANVISSHIPGFSGGIEGPCFYQNDRTLLRGIDGSLEDLKLDPSSDRREVSMDKLIMTIQEAASHDLFFLKHVSKFQELEYRLLWFSKSRDHSNLHIKCPEAREFCTRFEDLET